MSAEAMAHVFRCSPYKGASAEQAVLVALADTVSDVHDNQVWMGQTELAAKARVSVRSCRDAVRSLQDDGWLRLVQASTHRDPARYEFVLRDREAVWEPRSVRTRRAREEAAAGAANAAGPERAASPEPAAGPADDAGQVRQELPVRGEAASAEPKRTQQQPKKRSASPPVAASGDDQLLELGDGTVVDLADPDGSFDAWWPRYPRQHGTRRPGGGASPSKTRKRWARLTVDQRRAAFVALPNYTADLAITGTDVAHALTWLNQERWEIHAEPPDLTLDPVAAALVAGCGGDPDRVADGARVELARAVHGLPEGTTPSDVSAVVKAWRKEWPNADPSPLGLVRHWHRFAARTSGRPSGALCGACGQPQQGHDVEVCEMLKEGWMTPDQITYRYSISYERARPAGLGGGMVQYAEPFTLQDVHAAMDAHHVARRGGWVEPGMHRPHVSALLVCSGGRILGERLPGADLDEVPHAMSLAAHG